MILLDIYKLHFRGSNTVFHQINAQTPSPRLLTFGNSISTTNQPISTKFPGLQSKVFRSSGSEVLWNHISVRVSFLSLHRCVYLAKYANEPKTRGATCMGGRNIVDSGSRLHCICNQWLLAQDHGWTSMRVRPMQICKDIQKISYCPSVHLSVCHKIVVHHWDKTTDTKFMKLCVNTPWQCLSCFKNSLTFVNFEFWESLDTLVARVSYSTTVSNLKTILQFWFFFGKTFKIRKKCQVQIWKNL